MEQPIPAVAADSEEIAAAAIERIVVEYEPLPFVIDPLDTLRPGSPNGRQQGNVFVGNALETLKWTAEDMAKVDAGQFPANAAASETLVFGDFEKGFAEADLVIERDHNQQTTSHQPLETRTAMAYWQNGKLYLHGSTQSVARTVAAVAGWVGIKPEELVLISEYTGGGFGSKIPGAHSMTIPALLSKKLNGRPVMKRISREEETYIGRTRPGYQGWIKMGFKKDGRMTACDVFVVEAAGPYRRQGDHATSANNASLVYQVPNMRFRGVSVATNTPPGTSQRAPGGLQTSVMFEPMTYVARLRRELQFDRPTFLVVHLTAAHWPYYTAGSPFGVAAKRRPEDRPMYRIGLRTADSMFDQVVHVLQDTFSSYLAAEKLSVGSKSAENNWAVMQYLSSLGRDDKGKKLKGVRLKHSCIGFPCDPEEYAIKGFTFVGKVNTGDLPIQIYVVEGHESIKIAYIWTAKYESGYYVPTCEDVEKAPITRSNIYPFYDKTRPSLSTESVEFITCIPETWLSNILVE